MYTRPLTAQEVDGAKATILDPVQFCGSLLDSHLWSAQEWMLRAISKPHARVAVKACHASGKTFAAALAVLWFITRYRPAIAVTTAPTWTQVEKLLWGEIHKAVERGHINYPKINQTELDLGGGNYAIGISTNEAERFQGFHEKRVLVALDEGPGVRPAIWEGIEGIRAGGDVRELALGNPVIASGPFFDAFNSQREAWQTLTIGAFDTPNLMPLIGNRNVARMSDEKLVAFLEKLSEDELNENPYPYLTTRRWVLEKWQEWGRSKNPLWDARVMGRFPKQATDALLPLAIVEMAGMRETKFQKRHQLQVGIDVAGPGETETVMYVVDGPNIVDFHAWNDPDPRGKCLAALRPWKSRKPRVKVDNIGLGYYFTEHLRDHDFDVIGVNVGASSNDSERYTNLKGQLYWGLRERFEDGAINGLVDEKTISQLVSIKYKHDARGRTVIESKEELTKRGVQSPDRAESLMLAFAEYDEDGGSGFSFV